CGVVTKRPQQKTPPPKKQKQYTTQKTGWKGGKKKPPTPKSPNPFGKHPLFFFFFFFLFFFVHREPVFSRYITTHQVIRRRSRDSVFLVTPQLAQGERGRGLFLWCVYGCRSPF